EPSGNLCRGSRLGFEGGDAVRDALIVDQRDCRRVIWRGGPRDVGRRHQAVRSYQPRLLSTMRTTDSMTGTSTSTPTTVARAAPDWKPKRAIAAATASSKKFDAPISADGQATECGTPSARFSP